MFILKLLKIANDSRYHDMDDDEIELNNIMEENEEISNNHEQPIKAGTDKINFEPNQNNFADPYSVFIKTLVNFHIALLIRQT